MYLGATARAADDPLQAELVARLGPRANYCAVEILNDVSDPQRGADFRACVVKVRRQSRPYGLKIFRDRTDPGTVTGVFRTLVDLPTDVHVVNVQLHARTPS